MNWVAAQIIKECNLEQDNVYYALTLQAFIWNIEKSKEDAILYDLLKNLLIDIFNFEDDRYYYRRFCNLESFQFDYKSIKYALCAWSPIPIIRNEDMETRFKLIERRILR